MLIPYDAGKFVDAPGWICLQRNENQFISQELSGTILVETSRSFNPARYPDSHSAELKARLAELHGVKPENIYVGNGSDGVLADLLVLLRNQYVRVNLPMIGYKVYDLLASRYGYEVSRYDARSKQIKPARGLWLVDSPNAITGEVISEAMLDQLASSPDAFLIWDNCYGDFESDRLCVRKLDNIAIVRSFSKYYGLAGVRLGYCVAAEKLVAALERVKDVYNVNAAAQALGMAALNRREVFMRLSEKMLGVRSILCSKLLDLGFRIADPHGNFVFIHHPEIPGNTLQAGLEQYQILVRRFDYPQISDCLRVTVPSEHDLDKVVQSFCSLVNRFEASFPGKMEK
jgi:histidinol-phosphate aminotransferase